MISVPYLIWRSSFFPHLYFHLSDYRKLLKTMSYILLISFRFFKSGVWKTPEVTELNHQWCLQHISLRKHSTIVQDICWNLVSTCKVSYIVKPPTATEYACAQKKKKKKKKGLVWTTESGTYIIKTSWCSLSPQQK